MKRNLLLAASIGWLILGAPGSAPAQTVTGTLDTPTETFFVTLEDPGQSRFTLTWDDPLAQLALTVGCNDGVGGTIIFGTAVAAQDRIATLDVGMIPGALCFAAIDLLGGTTAEFALNLQVTDPNGFGLEEVRLVVRSDAELGSTALIDTVRRLLNDHRQRIKALGRFLRGETGS